MVLAICRFHRNSNGWNDIGYNALVDRFGNIYAGRDGGLGRAVIGAHAQGFNAQTTGVAVIGTHTRRKISKPAMRGVARWLAWKLPEHGHDTTGKARMISAGGDASRYPAGETDQNPADHRPPAGRLDGCPGDALYRQLGNLRNKVQRRIEARSELTASAWMRMRARFEKRARANSLPVSAARDANHLPPGANRPPTQRAAP